MYNVAQAKSDFKQGWIDQFSLIRKNDAWMMEISNSRTEIIRVLTAARGGERYFMTVDAAVKVAESIGFQVHELKMVII